MPLRHWHRAPRGDKVARMSGFDRYQRQALFAPLGAAGQARLGAARVAIVGAGALGTHLVNLLARGGVGFLRVIDRDVVEWTNLHRQVMFDESDAREGRPKAEAAAAAVARFNAEVAVEPRVADLSPRNAAELLAGVDLILDGTDNVETRYLINDFAVKTGVPWIYGGAVGSTAVACAFAPGGPCLRCLWDDPPPPGSLPTCDTAGVLPSAPALAASLQAAWAMRALAGDAIEPWLVQIDVWDGQTARVRVRKRDDCKTCVRGAYEFADAKATSWTTNLCGRGAVQVSPPEAAPLDLAALASRFAPLGEVRRKGLYLEFDVEGHTLMVFADSRVIVKNTTDPIRARTLVARYLGL